MTQQALWKVGSSPASDPVNGFEVGSFLVEQWRHGFTESNILFHFLATDYQVVMSDHQNLLNEMNEPLINSLMIYFRRYMIVTGQRLGLRGVIRFSHGTTYVISSEHYQDHDAKPDGEYLYIHQVGHHEILRLPLAYLHPEFIANGLEPLRQQASRWWVGKLPIPQFGS